MRPFVWPAVFLGAVTIGVAGWRGTTHPSPAPAKPHHRAVLQAPKQQYYRVRAGDTLSGVATRIGVPLSRLLALNPKVQPTALFLGQRIRVR